MKAIKRLIKKVEWLYNSYIWNPLHLRAKVKKAKKYHGITGKRYYVVPGTEKSLVVVDNSYIKNYNKQKGVRRINHLDLIKMAYYATPARGLSHV